MASHSTTMTSLLKVFPTKPRLESFSRANPPPQYLSGASALSAQRFPSRFNLKCNATSSPRTEGAKNVLPVVYRDGLPVINWNDVLKESTDVETCPASASELIEERVASVRSILRSMEDGEISISAYDTAWVALVEDVNGSGGPQFPSSLQWIANNQLPDGSWGDSLIFSAYDRIINTLACVIALKSWNMHPDKSEKGTTFIKQNIVKMKDEKAEHMPIGFEVAFPSLLERAKRLGIDIPDDSPAIQEIYALRDLKITRIPKDIMHIVPTTLLHTLEGVPGLEWEKLLKLQCADGSFLFSPSATAYALIHTKDSHCLTYLTKAVEKFNGGVPNVYPVDLFEHLWAVDRLQRLGISRYFQSEINRCMDYVSRCWTDQGICWARNSRVHDIDDTAMGFRLLRLHGYAISADVFRNFEKNGEFFAFAGQCNQAVTGMYNLYRASQLMFPGETILDDAKKFSSSFLHEKRANHELFDKWIITKDLPGEVGYALDVPWYASLPRIETRFYLEQYGGENDVWIGKTLYRMPYVNNNIYLEVAKLDYNNIQALHQLEWKSMQEWYNECSLTEYGISKTTLLVAYHVAAACIFEPERSKERLAWAKTTILMEATIYHFDRSQISEKQKSAFIYQFEHSNNFNHTSNEGTNKTRQTLIKTILGTLSQLSLDSLLANGGDIRPYLRHAWSKWLHLWEEGADLCEGEAELLVRTLNLCAGHWLSEESLLSHAKYQRLLEITIRVCRQLRLFQRNKVLGAENPLAKINGITTTKIESDMQELVKLVLSNSCDDLDVDIRQTFLTVAKSFYYTAYCNPGTINFHIAKANSSWDT